MDVMTQAYLAAAVWTATGVDGEPLEDAGYSLEDFTSEADTDAQADCDSFHQAAGDLLDGITDEQAGHDFWLTRNGHGTGFWDRGLGKVGDKLTALCKPYGSRDVYVGDDNALHFA